VQASEKGSDPTASDKGAESPQKGSFVRRSYPDQPKYVIYSLEDGVKVETDEQSLPNRMKKAVDAEQELEMQMEELSTRLARAKSTREGLEQQLKADQAATDTMNKAFAKRREREERELGMRGDRGPGEPATWDEVEAEEKAKAVPVAAVSTKKRAGLKNLMRSRTAKKRSTMDAAIAATSAETDSLKKPVRAENAIKNDPVKPVDVMGLDEPCFVSKPIYVVSDCTGESAANTVRCALGQFEQCVDQSVPTNLVIFRFVSKEREVYEIFTRAQADNALVVTSLVKERVKRATKVASQTLKVRMVDLWTDLLDNMEEHLHLVRSGVPLGSSKTEPKLSADYFRMIEAVEYTRKMDDGAKPECWHEADILLLGVSRTGKTPLAIYLGQRGYKVANLPLVVINGKFMIPKQLHEMDQNKIIGLLIDPDLLLTIRSQRMDSMGVGQSSRSSNDTYDSLMQCKKEVDKAKELYAANPTWPVLDVTYRAVEESAARILRIFSDRDGPMHPRDAENKEIRLKDIFIDPAELAAFKEATAEITSSIG